MEDIEFQRPEAIKAYQEGRLAEALQYLAEHSKYYQRMFGSYHIDIAKIRTLEDLVRRTCSCSTTISCAAPRRRSWITSRPPARWGTP